MSTTDYKLLVEEAKKQKYNEVNWSKNENLYKITKNLHRSPHSVTEVIPVSLVLDIRLKLSCFGPLMKNFNENQVHNNYWHENTLGIEMYNYMNFDEDKKKSWDITNNLTDNILTLLEKAVQTKKVVDYEFFYENLQTLRLTNGPINRVDSLAKFDKLEVLVLASNWIKKIKRKDLPPNLLYLECYGNEITNVRSLCMKSGPQRLKYLGLGRNNLDKTSCLYLMADSRTFKELSALDISNNELQSLVRLLEELSPLQQLTALAIEGNPCYVCEGYKYNVLAHFPNLLYLDGTEILNHDRPLRNDLFIRHLATKASFQFTCYRIVGLPPPPKSKATHTYYLEIDLPLLEPIRIPRRVSMKSEYTDTWDLSSMIKLRSESFSKSAVDLKGKKVTPQAGAKKDQKDAKVKAVDGVGLYALPNEVEMVENDYLTFRTEEKPWSKIMKFQEPTITIDVPYDNFTFLRDTFKSRVRVKLVYAQKFINKPKKPKLPSAEANSKTSFSSGQSRNNSDEVTLKRSTLSTFYCDLQPVNWSDQSVDFIWADHPQFGDTAVLVDGTLKPEIYEEKASTPPKKTKGETGRLSVATIKNPLPKTLTCNIGFSLRRYSQDNRKLSNLTNV